VSSIEIKAVNIEHLFRRHFDAHALEVLGRVHRRCIELAQERQEPERAIPSPASFSVTPETLEGIREYPDIS
jgi:hypothetical protein